MGYGGIEKSQSNLAAYSSAATGNLNSFAAAANTQGAELQQQAANAQAGSYEAQAGYAVQYAQEQADQERYQIGITAGQQAEGYASGGVQQMGTPLAMINTTLALGAIQAKHYETQGALQSQLFMTEAANAEQSGLNDILSAQSQNLERANQTMISNQQQDQQAKIQLATQETAALDSFLTAGISSGISLLGAAIM